MTLQITAPTFDLIPSFRQAIAAGYTGTCSGFAYHPDDDAFWYAMHNPPTFYLTPTGERSEAVPESFYWLHEDGRFLGAVALRHRLTPALEREGGNIGYAVHPDFRGHGHAKLLLRHALAEAAALGLDRALITIDVANIASLNVTEACGGILHDTIPVGSKQQRRYFVNLKEQPRRQG